MSKGSKQRPGTGYADNWDRVFGKKDYQIEVAGDSVFGLDPSKTYRTEVAKDGSVRYFETDARQHVRDEAIAEAVSKYGTYPCKVWNMQPNGSLLPADGGDPLKHDDPTRITGNFRCKINGLDTGAEVTGFEFLPQAGFNYVLEAIEPPAKTCQHCKHWATDFISNREACQNIILIDMMESREYARFESPPDSFCNRWEVKV